MYEQDEDQVINIASFGTGPESEKNINEQNEILKSLILKGECRHSTRGKNKN